MNTSQKNVDQRNASSHTTARRPKPLTAWIALELEVSMARMSWILRAYQIDLSIKTMPQLMTNCLATILSKLPSSVNFMIIRTWTKPEKLIQVPAPRCVLRHDTGDAFQTAEVMRSHKIPGHGRARPLPCGDFITSNLGIDSRKRWKFRKHMEIS